MVKTSKLDIRERKKFSDGNNQVSENLVNSVKTRLQELSTIDYPILKQYSKDDLYDHGRWLSPGGYLMMHLITEELQIKSGARILDLGCGNGQSSIFLATKFDAKVVAIDLWIDVADRNRSAQANGVLEKITNIQMDISKGLGEDLGEFDYIISVQAFHCFGAENKMMKRLTPLLKRGGKFGIIQSCFSKEIDELPAVFLDSKGWEMDYANYHYPKWWEQHFAKNGYHITTCKELVQGKAIWEDNISYFGKKYNWSTKYFHDYGWLMEQVLYNQDGFFLTHFILTAKSPNSAMH